MNLPRRDLLRSLTCGSAALLPGILQLAGLGSARADAPNPLAPRNPHFAARAKRVIFLFSAGGVSHLDTFDPKPALADRNGEASKKNTARKYLASPWKFSPGGKCGTQVSDIFPHLRGCMDDICLVRSLYGDHNDHAQATLGLHGGSVNFVRPSLGSWVSYGLGTENQNLPSFVVLAPKLPYGGGQPFSADFLPGAHAGLRVSPGAEPVPNLNRRSATPHAQELELGLLARFNQLHREARAPDPRLEARIKSYETAFGMQAAMPDVLDLSKESDATLNLYGMKRDTRDGYGWQCLIARRMIERGVRFVEVLDVGASNNWDSHSNLRKHGELARNIDRPIAGLLRDLKSRGLLEDTLVVWSSEFGRTPTSDSPDGRAHQASVYSAWMAGGGVRAGTVYGSSDEIGQKPAENPVHVHDFHATILHCLGFDHTRLTFPFGGRDFRLTDIAGNVVPGLLA